MRVRIVAEFCHVRRRGRGVEGVVSWVGKTFGDLQIHVSGIDGVSGDRSGPEYIQRISDHTILAILAETDVRRGGARARLGVLDLEDGRTGDGRTQKDQMESEGMGLMIAFEGGVEVLPHGVENRRRQKAAMYS